MNEEQFANSQERFRELDHRDKLFRGFEVLVLIVLVTITLFSLFQLSKVADSNQKNIIKHAMQVDDVGGANRARLDVGLCIISVSPTVRTPAYVKSCYDKIEKQYGIKVERFGDGV